MRVVDTSALSRRRCYKTTETRVRMETTSRHHTGGYLPADGAMRERKRTRTTEAENTAMPHHDGSRTVHSLLLCRLRLAGGLFH
jgi:hypothetical protein